MCDDVMIRYLVAFVMTRKLVRSSWLINEQKLNVYFQVQNTIISLNGNEIETEMFGPRTQFQINCKFTEYFCILKINDGQWTLDMTQTQIQSNYL